MRTDKFFKDVLGCGIMESIVEFAQTKANKELKKTVRAHDAALLALPLPIPSKPSA